tara:strand:- start:21063 stop:22118 length:1056 start_codon:yes stop_codon:yes gene_type:complete
MTKINKLFQKNQASKPLVCVEMSGNHQNNLQSAIEFLNEAYHQGADILKLQVYTADTITLKSKLPDFKVQANNEWSKYSTMYDLYSKAFTPWDWIEKIFLEAKKIGIEVFASPFDITALNFLESLNCPAYKIASPEITDHNLIRACAKTGKPVVLSTGLASEVDIDEAVDILKESNSRYLILKCISVYPTKNEDLNLITMNWLKKKYGCNVGLSDHSIGFEAALAATALGASLIEKHFKLDGDDSSIDASFSMELSELPRLKKSIELVYKSIGENTLRLPEEAKLSYSGRRSLYVVEDIEGGEAFTLNNIRSIRPCYGLHPKYLNDILGKKANVFIKKGTRLSWELIDLNS